ncbi:hypothetical protein COM96_26955 [Bacillus cereus]|uniref:Uncharacterized protein n=1 Tax=Bacillus cereus TaxID=1396 RepID=A0A2A7HQF2_BACCE|nr:hypothetical protein COM96_26955 [Bacillus cereus]
MDALLVRLIFYAGTEWLGFRTLFSSCNLLYQVIKELHIASLSKVFGYTKPKFIKLENTKCIPLLLKIFRFN